MLPVRITAATARELGLRVDHVADEYTEDGLIAALTAARDYLTALRSTTNPSWKGFLMVERMLSRHGRIPPRMFGLAAPLIDELIRKLIPLLEQVARLDDFPRSTVEKLRSGCQELQESDDGDGAEGAVADERHDLFVYGHLPLSVGIAMAGVGIEDLVAHPFDALPSDGGWTVDFESSSPAASLEWRGYATVAAVRTLQPDASG